MARPDVSRSISLIAVKFNWFLFKYIQILLQTSEFCLYIDKPEILKVDSELNARVENNKEPQFEVQNKEYESLLLENRNNF